MEINVTVPGEVHATITFRADLPAPRHRQKEAIMDTLAEVLCAALGEEEMRDLIVAIMDKLNVSQIRDLTSDLQDGSLLEVLYTTRAVPLGYRFVKIATGSKRADSFSDFLDEVDGIKEDPMSPEVDFLEDNESDGGGNEE